MINYITWFIFVIEIASELIIDQPKNMVNHVTDACWIKKMKKFWDNFFFPYLFFYYIKKISMSISKEIIDNVEDFVANCPIEILNSTSVVFKANGDGPLMNENDI